jgi:hypothetical protein
MLIDTMAVMYVVGVLKELIQLEFRIPYNLR